jgi:hypothetical protein
MKRSALLTLALMLAAAPAWAQSSSPDNWHGTNARRRAVTSANQAGQRPIDHGPYTPQANSAYQGGGVVLQGAPGAPAPMPQATPPGQMPANSVPAR